MQRGIVKLLAFVKMRTFARSGEELWLDEWKNPLAREVKIGDPNKFLENLQRPLKHDGYAFFSFLLFSEISKKALASCYFDKITTGFLTWSRTIKGYEPVLDDENSFLWEAESLPCLDVIREGISEEGYIDQLSSLWSQECSKGNTLDVRTDNSLFFKYLGMWLFKSSFYSLLKNFYSQDVW